MNHDRHRTDHSMFRSVHHDLTVKARFQDKLPHFPEFSSGFRKRRRHLGLVLGISIMTPALICSNKLR